MTKIQEEIDHWVGVIAGLSSEHPAWTDAQKRVAALRARLAALEEVKSRPAPEPSIPDAVLKAVEEDLNALDALEAGGGA